MIRKTVEKIENTIQNIDSINNNKKKELIQLLSTLKSEIEELSKTQDEHAHSIAGFTEVASHEATRSEKEVDLVNLAISGLSLSVKGMEISHPALVKTVNDLCNLLSSIGI